MESCLPKLGPAHDETGISRLWGPCDNADDQPITPLINPLTVEPGLMMAMMLKPKGYTDILFGTEF
jgi:hypothetical protein